MDRNQVIQALNNELAELDEIIERVHRESEERLEALPWAARCIEDQEKAGR